jgi:ubiquinone/menaquinone biosynthesis C-methylase UbiE
LRSNAFSESEKAAIEDAIKNKYQAVSSGAAGFFSYAVGKEGALRLGYEEKLLNPLPEKVLNAFCGVGNPFSLGTIAPGSVVLDIGCGAGFDLYVASTLTGGNGHVFGVDLTYPMAARAMANLSSLTVDNANILNACGDRLPLVDNSFDVVISNGAINLSPEKPKLFAEIHRVLKPGGRLHFADIILDGNLPPHLSTGVESWSQ